MTQKYQRYYQTNIVKKTKLASERIIVVNHPTSKFAAILRQELGTFR